MSHYVNQYGPSLQIYIDGLAQDCGILSVLAMEIA